jgi:hypothetical protein
VANLGGPQPLLRHMQTKLIHCIASGGQAPNFRFFFFAQKQQDRAAIAGSYFLVECLVNTASKKCIANYKADEAGLVQSFADNFKSAVQAFGS